MTLAFRLLLILSALMSNNSPTIAEIFQHVTQFVPELNSFCDECVSE